MNTSFEIFLGLRYLRSKRKRSAISVLTWLSVIGVSIGVMALNVVLSVMNGYDQELKKDIVGINPHIVVAGYHNQPLSHPQDFTSVIAKMDHVVSVGPYVQGQALARSKERALGIMVWGVDPEHPQALADLDKYLFEAKARDLIPPASDGAGREDRIFLGSLLAQRLRVGLGDDLILFLPNMQMGPMGMTPQSVKFQVVGLFTTGMFDYDSSFAYVALPIAQKMYNLGDDVTGVAVKVDNVDLAPALGLQIRKSFGDDYFVQDWLQVNHNFFMAIHMEKITLGVILSLIVLVAALNIVNPLSIMVIEKTKEIGILKAMGGSNKSIMGIFVFQGMFIGVLGILLGLALGFVLCEIIAIFPIHIPGGGMVYYIDRLPVKVEPLVSYLLVPVMALILCFLATLYPAWQAAKLEPVDAIRYE